MVRFIRRHHQSLGGCLVRLANLPCVYRPSFGKCSGRSASIDGKYHLFLSRVLMVSDFSYFIGLRAPLHFRYPTLHADEPFPSLRPSKARNQRPTPITSTMDQTLSFDSDIFTFLVGEKAVQYSVHEGILADLSSPLRAMMTNGMQETATKTCTLKYVEPEIFNLFLQFLYRGVYRAGKPAFDAQPTQKTAQAAKVFAPVAGPSDLERSKTKGKLSYCAGCGDCLNTLNCMCTPQFCRIDKNIPKHRRSREYCTGCGRLSQQVGMERNYSLDYPGTLCASCKCGNTERKPATESRKPFEHKRYAADGLNHEDFRQWLENMRPTDTATDDPCLHAKLYVFATQYLVKKLQQHCLHKLH